METIELKPKPINLAIRVFLLVFISSSIFKYLWFGWYSPADILLFLRARVIEALVATATFSLVLAIPYFQKRFNICLTETTLRAPVKRKRFEFAKPITFDLSEISVSRSLRDRLIGAEVVTADGEPLQIHSIFYGRKSISKLLDAIENRQKT
jgi:hypothetical protein